MGIVSRWLEERAERRRQKRIDDWERSQPGEIVGYLSEEDLEIYKELNCHNLACKLVGAPEDQIKEAHEADHRNQDAIRAHFGIPLEEEIDISYSTGSVRRLFKTREQAQAERRASIAAYDADAPRREAEIRRLTGRGW